MCWYFLICKERQIPNKFFKNWLHVWLCSMRQQGRGIWVNNYNQLERLLAWHVKLAMQGGKTQVGNGKWKKNWDRNKHTRIHQTNIHFLLLTICQQIRKSINHIHSCDNRYSPSSFLQPRNEKMKTPTCEKIYRQSYNDVTKNEDRNSCLVDL